MRFCLVDRITELEPGNRITAVKTVSMAEEYLADHFPGFPVLPGVLMLEAMVQAGAWLVRATENFSHSTIVLKDARNIRFGNFVEPGCQLVLTAKIQQNDDQQTRLQCSGSVGGSAAVSGRLTLGRSNLRDRHPDLARTDEFQVQQLRELFSLLWNPGSVQKNAAEALGGT